MALTLRNRPRGPIKGSTGLSATITNSSNQALVNYNTHNLSNGDIVFIESNYSNYSGFWQVIISGANAFFLTKFVGSPVIAYTYNDSITFYKSSVYHYFNSVHLPIVYSFDSDLWPVNTATSIVSVNTFTNDQGYTKLTLSGNLLTGVNELEFVTVTVNSVEGVYQILNAFSDSEITIDLPYDGGNTFGGVQYYYSGYHAKIRVYAGNSNYPLKPVELLAELDIYPELVSGVSGSETNIINVNVDEVIKSKINVLSNVPTEYDTDAFCEFYIEYAESYDQSPTGYTLGTYTSSYTTDTVTCYAINSKLPFKNRYSGFMSEYLGSARKFLTTMSPTIFSNYFDLAFLLEPNLEDLDIYMRLEGYSGTTLLGTTYNQITYRDAGVYREEITASTEETIDATLVIRNTPASATAQVIGLNGSGATSTIDYFIASGSTPTETYSIFVSIGAVFDPGDLAVGSVIYNYIDGTTGTVQQLLISSQTSISVSNVVFPSPSKDVVSITISANTTQAGAANTVVAQVDLAGLATSYIEISETKTINVDSECSNQSIYLTWKNYFGGHDYWLFTGEKEYGVDITGTTESTKPIFSEWPKSYGEFSDTLDYETSRTSKDNILVRSQNLNLAQVQGLKYIKTSPLVQVMTSKSDRMTVMVDPTSFVVYSETDKLYGMQFTIRFTDNIPSQSV